MTVAAVAAPSVPLQTGWPSAPSQAGHQNFLWGPNATHAHVDLDLSRLPPEELASLMNRGVISLGPPPPPGGYPAELRGPSAVAQPHAYTSGGPGFMWGPGGPTGPAGAQAREQNQGGFWNKVTNFTGGVAKVFQHASTVVKAVGTVAAVVV